MALQQLHSEILRCTQCSGCLPNSPKPILQVNSSAKILIAGQAPGHKAHSSGVPFDDASGVRLRQWMGVDDSVFYDSTLVAILPMGFCYPGKGTSGDLSPRKICADLWRAPLLNQLTNIRLKLIIGSYAIKYHLPDSNGSLTEIVKQWKKHSPRLFPLPHPSPRNNIWLKKNSWFEADVLPALRLEVDRVLTC